jgi:hypothetical protein
MPHMSSIVEFLEARIAEDLEVAVRAYEEGDRGDVHPLGVTTVGLSEDPGIFITPQRLTDECKAKRALVQAIPKWHERNEGDAYYSCPQTQFETLPANAWRDGDYPGAATTPGSDLTDEECNCGLEYRRMAILGPLASVYSDHPDFDASWNA